MAMAITPPIATSIVTLPLEDWLSLKIYVVLLVFVRVGTAFMLMPGYGEPTVPVRMRLLAAFGIGVAVAPVIAGMPAVVPTSVGIVLGVSAEAVCGALLGTLSRTLVSAILSAGTVIGQNIGLSNIFTQGLGTDQSATIGAAVYAGLIATLFAADGHHAIIRSLVESYRLLPPGQFPTAGDSAHAVVRAGITSFRLVGQLALPFLLLALVFNASLAAINRAMPAMPVFNLGAPAIVVAGLYLLAATVPGLIEQGLAAYSDMLQTLR